MSKHSFANKLTWKIVVITSVIFLLAVVLVALYGGKIVYKRSIDYSVEKLNTAVAGIEDVMDCIEYSTVGIGRTFEVFYRTHTCIDTLNIYRLFRRTLDENPFFVGIGVYFEPNIIPGNSRFGLYSWKDYNSGRYGNELYSDSTLVQDNYWNYFDYEWYSKCRDDAARHWTSPYWEFVNNDENGDCLEKRVSSFSFPLTDGDGRLFGVCSCDLELDWIRERLDLMKPFPNSSVYITDDMFNYVSSPEIQKLFPNTLLDSPLKHKSEWNELVWVEKDGVSIAELDGHGVPAFVVARQIRNGWTIGIINSNKDVFTDVFLLFIAFITISFLGIVTLYLAARKLTRKVSRPIVSFAGVANRITGGDFNVPVPKLDTDDEIDDLGKALEYMQHSITEYISELKRTTSEKERLESELNVARTIQMQMLIRHFPDMPGCHIFADSNPAREVGGDLYDFHVIGDDVYFIIGDVCGKSVPAALLMAITISAFRASVKKGGTTAEIVSTINDTFIKSNDDFMFVTLIVGKLNVVTGEMHFCNAGHNPMMLISDEGVSSFLDECPNVACGISPDYCFVQERITLAPGSRVIIYSDGVTEAMDNDRMQFGTDRLLEWGSRNSLSDVKCDDAAVDDLFRTVMHFADGAEQSDDMTVASITYLE